MTDPTKSPKAVAVATAPEATKFQQSKRILTLTLIRLNAIFCMRVFSLGDMLTLFLAVLVLIVVEVLK